MLTARLTKKNRSSRKSGFTLIELLVTIGILGILASALVATIDPFEQLKKATDARVQNVAVEFFNSTIRYYTTHNALPWKDTTNTACLGGTQTGLSAQSLWPSMSGCLTSLVSEGELKNAFTTATNDLSLIMINESSNNLTVCYSPQSKSGQKAAQAAYDASGLAKSGCPAVGSGCFWCTK